MNKVFYGVEQLLLINMKEDIIREVAALIPLTVWAVEALKT